MCFKHCQEQDIEHCSVWWSFVPFPRVHPLPATTERLSPQAPCLFLTLQIGSRHNFSSFLTLNPTLHLIHTLLAYTLTFSAAQNSPWIDVIRSISVTSGALLLGKLYSVCMCMCVHLIALRQDLSIELRAYQFCHTGWPARSQDPCVFTSQCWVYRHAELLPVDRMLVIKTQVLTCTESVLTN